MITWLRRLIATVLAALLYVLTLGRLELNPSGRATLTGRREDAAVTRGVDDEGT